VNNEDRAASHAFQAERQHVGLIEDELLHPEAVPGLTVQLLSDLHGGYTAYRRKAHRPITSAGSKQCACARFGAANASDQYSTQQQKVL